MPASDPILSLGAFGRQRRKEDRREGERGWGRWEVLSVRGRALDVGLCKLKLQLLSPSCHLCPLVNYNATKLLRTPKAINSTTGPTGADLKKALRNCELFHVELLSGNLSKVTNKESWYCECKHGCVKPGYVVLGSLNQVWRKKIEEFGDDS